MDKDIATNLYSGLQSGSNNFNPDTASALTFEAAALCLRSGAQRAQAATRPAAPGPKSQPVASPRPQPQPARPAAAQTTGSAPVQPKAPKAKADSQKTKSPADEAKKDDGQASTNGEEDVPSDWLKPKIFTAKSNGSN